MHVWAGKSARIPASTQPYLTPHVHHPPPSHALWLARLPCCDGRYAASSLGMPASIWWCYPSPEGPVCSPPKLQQGYPQACVERRCALGAVEDAQTQLNIHLLPRYKPSAHLCASFPPGHKREPGVHSARGFGEDLFQG